ncbi:MAG: hypothetical protein KY453_06425 [Gemmatimonadetes bacterium]|nr:hypothetical protein [Gemmatimonadota bacterium]
MTTLGLPTSMFLVFLATILAGSLGAIHYVIAHVILKRPFAELPPPVVREKETFGEGGTDPRDEGLRG